MATIGDVQEQLSQIDELSLQYKGDETVINGLVGNLSSQIQLMHELDLAEATRFTAQVSGSRLSDICKDTLARTVLARAMELRNNPPARGRNAGPNGTQCLESPLEYFSAADYEALEKAATAGAGALVAAERLMSLRVYNASESTVKGISALVACFVWQTRMPSPHEAHGLTTAVKAELRALVAARGKSGPGLAVYPASPAALPLELARAAYAVADPPVHRVLPRYQIMRQHMVMRWAFIVVELL